MIQTDAIAAIRDSICESNDRLFACLDGLTPGQLNWTPPAEGANSIYAIASHALSAAAGLILVRAFHQQVETPPHAGWGAEGESAEPLRARWQELRPRIHQTLTRASQADLERECEHPRLGKMSAWQMLLLANRHTSEHIGHIELTRDLAKAAGA